MHVLWLLPSILFSCPVQNPLMVFYHVHEFNQNSTPQTRHRLTWSTQSLVEIPFTGDSRLGQVDNYLNNHHSLQIEVRSRTYKY